MEADQLSKTGLQLRENAWMRWDHDGPDIAEHDPRPIPF